MFVVVDVDAVRGERVTQDAEKRARVRVGAQFVNLHTSVFERRVLGADARFQSQQIERFAAQQSTTLVRYFNMRLIRVLLLLTRGNVQRVNEIHLRGDDGGGDGFPHRALFRGKRAEERAFHVHDAVHDFSSELIAVDVPHEI